MKNQNFNSPKFILCDTHILLWILQGSKKNFTAATREILNESQIVISPITEMELDYLHEIKRIKLGGQEVMSRLIYKLGGLVDVVSLNHLVGLSKEINWTRDPFDRLIVANSLLLNIPLLTADKQILANYKNSFSPTSA